MKTIVMHPLRTILTHSRTYIVVLLVGTATALSFFLFSPTVVTLSLISILVVFWVLSEPRKNIHLCILFSFVPLCAGAYFGKELPISYFIVPIITISYFLSKFMQNETIHSMKPALNPFWILILIYFSMVFANFLRNPIFLSDVFELKYKSLGIHAWMRYVLSFCYYLIFLEVASTDLKMIKKAIKFLWWLCVVLSILGVILVYSHLAQNLLYKLQHLGIISPEFFSTGGVDLMETRYRDLSGGAHIGTVALIASIGLFLLLSQTLGKMKNLTIWICSAFFTFALILSGIRSFFIGTSLTVAIWLLIKKKPRYILGLLMLFTCLYVAIFVCYQDLPEVFQRSFRLMGSFQELDIGRTKVFQLFLQSFLNHPLFGVGIGSSGFRYSSNWSSFFISEQLRTGGHGTYSSLLYLFGLVGFIPFVIILIQGIRLSYQFLLKTESKFEKSLIMFCFLFLIFYLIPMAFAGTGSDPFYFAILGIISGLWVKRRKEVLS